MKTNPTIEVLTKTPSVVIGEMAIVSAPTVDEMYAALGRPSRIDSGATPAPVGHRNNQIHVYDCLGLVFHEHHYTRRAQGIWCWSELTEPGFAFTPHEPFRGRIHFDGIVMPLGGRDIEFVHLSPFKFALTFGGVWRFAFAGFSVILHSRGPKLRSGRRSKVRQITDVSISWPHDDWGEPAPSMVTIDELRREATVGRREDFNHYLAAVPDVAPPENDSLSDNVSAGKQKKPSQVTAKKDRGKS
jgi:hypothetical protein